MIMEENLRKYLQWRCKTSWHNKYHKYIDEWISNVLPHQLEYFKREMYNLNWSSYFMTPVYKEIPLKNKNGEIIKCDCGGTYKWNGTLLLCYPAKYPFYCDKCNKRITISAHILFPEDFPEFQKKKIIMTNKELIEILKQFPSEKEVLLSILPCSTKADELCRCGTYGIIKVEKVLRFIVISNHT